MLRMFIFCISINAARRLGKLVQMFEATVCGWRYFVKCCQNIHLNKSPEATSVCFLVDVLTTTLLLQSPGEQS